LAKKHGIFFGKIMAFDENHGFRDFRDFLLSLVIRCGNGRSSSRWRDTCKSVGGLHWILIHHPVLPVIVA